MKNLIFFYPTIYNDGLKKTFELYTKYLKKNFKIIIITNTSNNKVLKSISPEVKVINVNNVFLSKIKFINEIICLTKAFKFFEENSIIFSLDKHFYLLMLKFLGFKFKLILRIPNPIYNPFSLAETKFINKKIFTKNPGSVLGLLDLKFLKYSDKVIVYSKNHYRFLKKNYNLNNIEFIRNYFPKYNGKKKTKKKYNIFFVGRLVESKDPIFFLVNSLKLIKHINISIHIIGDGILFKKLIKISKNFKRKVKFYGFVNDPFKKYNKRMDLLCLTSKYDGTPNVLGEAVSYKIPCLAPRGVGCVNEILNNGKFGNLYKPGNSLNFKNMLSTSIKNYQDAIEKSKKAYKNLEKYSEKNTLKKLSKLLENF